MMSLGDVTGPRFGPEQIIQNAVAALEGRHEGGYAKGVAAYDAWREALLGVTKSDIAGMKDTMFGNYYLCVCNGEPLNCLSDGRKYAHRYFTQLAQEHPEQPLYAEIAKQFGRITEILRKKMARAMGGTEPCGRRQKKALARRGVRRKIAGYIGDMKAADERALALMKELLEAAR